MPWTFAHPSAVLPLRRMGRFQLPLAALVVGSVSPDLGYYAGQFGLATLAHTTLGIFLVCLPLGAVVLALFAAIRPALIQLLPFPHRQAVLEVLQATRPAPLGKRVLLAVVGLTVGAATHTVWDSVTHASGYVVQRLPLLQQAVWMMGSHQMHVYNLVQHASTLIGVTALAVTYLRWLRAQRPAPTEICPARERARYLILAGCVTSACAVGWLGGVDFGGSAPDVFRMVLFATDTFMALVILCALAWRRWGDGA